MFNLDDSNIFLSQILEIAKNSLYGNLHFLTKFITQRSFTPALRNNLNHRPYNKSPPVNKIKFQDYDFNWDIKFSRIMKQIAQYTNSFSDLISLKEKLGRYLTPITLMQSEQQTPIQYQETENLNVNGGYSIKLTKDESEKIANLFLSKGLDFSKQRDYTSAGKMFRHAESLGSTVASYNLGLIHYKGLGVKRNVQTSLYYFEKASQVGHERSTENTTLLKKQTDLQQIANKD